MIYHTCTCCGVEITRAEWDDLPGPGAYEVDPGEWMDFRDCPGRQCKNTLARCSPDPGPPTRVRPPTAEASAVGTST